MIEQPNKETEELLNALIEDEPEIVEMNGKSYKIGALRHGLVRKLTKIALTEKDERKVTTKSVAAIILRRFWRIKLFYWFLWRWFYYVKEIPETEMIKVFIAAKKKTTCNRILAEYHITDRDERHNNDDDEGRSKTFPSRTSWGTGWDIGKAHPSLMLPRMFFFFFQVDRWGYMWGYTIPQIELLAIDAPLIVYSDVNRKDKPTAKKIEETNKKWANKYGNTQGTKIDLTDLLSQYKPIK